MHLNIKKRNSYKKDGFTLIELVAALAIIAILSAVLVPKVSRYIDEAKKTKALEEVRQVILAVEDYNVSSDTQITDKSSFADISSAIKSDALDIDSIKSINSGMKYGTMKELIDGKKKFILKDGKIKITGNT